MIRTGFRTVITRVGNEGVVFVEISYGHYLGYYQKRLLNQKFSSRTSVKKYGGDV